MRYSPAPWKLIEGDDEGNVLVIMDEGHDVYIGNIEGTCGVCHANAYLIASAPELLAALESVIDATKCMREEYSDADDAVEKAGVIIAKAKGIQS